MPQQAHYYYYFFIFYFIFFIFAVVPISSPGCEYQFGLYSDGSACSTNYVKCEHGAAYSLPCDAGLAYDDRIKKCNWPDELVEVGCNPAGQLFGFYTTC